MICMVRALGAPVTEPEGNRAARMSGTGAVVREAMEEVICQTVS
jgi:hypothetical protein